MLQKLAERVVSSLLLQLSTRPVGPLDLWHEKPSRSCLCIYSLIDNSKSLMALVGRDQLEVHLFSA
jgi:hypothetical protein